MSFYQILRLINVHKWLIILAIALGAGSVWFLTRKEIPVYTVDSTIYTGFASGMNVDGGAGVEGGRFVTQSVFENLLTVMESDMVREEVALRILATHVANDTSHGPILTKQAEAHLNRSLPEEIRTKAKVDGNSEATFLNLKTELEKGIDNPVYKLIHSYTKYYGMHTMKQISFTRIKTSDLVKISFSTDDPLVARTTVDVFIQVIIQKYRRLKLSESSSVVEYFEKQVQASYQKLEEAEKKILAFREEHKILDYIEQVRAIAQKKEDFENENHKEKLALAETEAALKTSEEKIGLNEAMMKKNQEVFQRKIQFEEVNKKISIIRGMPELKDGDKKYLADLERESDSLKQLLTSNLSQIYAAKNSTAGLDSKEVISAWFDNLLKVASIKARLLVFDTRRIEYSEIYSEMAPIGSQMVKFEREIDILESEYLRMVEALNLAKLREQNISMTTELKIMDPPRTPPSAQPSKRKSLIIIGGIMGFVLILAWLIILEVIDSTIQTPERFQKFTDITVISAFPKFIKVTKSIFFDKIFARAADQVLRKILLRRAETNKQPMIIFIASTRPGEGKTTLNKLLSKRFVNLGYKIKSMEPEVPHEHGIKVKAMESLQQEMAETTRFVWPKTVEEEKDLSEMIGEDYNEKDIILFELPPLLEYPIPLKWLKSADAVVFMARSNRIWNKADDNALAQIKAMTDAPFIGMLNGVKLFITEDFIGDLPRKRGKLMSFIVKLARFEFGSRAQI